MVIGDDDDDEVCIEASRPESICFRYFLLVNKIFQSLVFIYGP